MLGPDEDRVIGHDFWQHWWACFPAVEWAYRLIVAPQAANPWHLMHSLPFYVGRRLWSSLCSSPSCRSKKVCPSGNFTLTPRWANV
jgi:hypothetical protein